jgi:hypothetical protein
MQFRQRLAAWSVTGFLQQAVLIGLGTLAALTLIAVAILLFGSIAVRAALPAVDRRIDAGWAEALGPLSTLPDRYPAIDTNTRARLLEASAAKLGVTLAMADDPAGHRPAAEETTDFETVRESLRTLTDGGRGGVAAARIVGPWLQRSRGAIDEVAGIIVADESPAWAMSLDQCSGSIAVDLGGLVDLHRVLIAATDRNLAMGDSTGAERFVEASWRLNEGLLRSPSLSEHMAAIAVTELQMEVLRRLDSTGSHWRIRLAALDLQRNTLEAYRFDAWRLRCLTDSFLADFNPLVGLIAHPFARLLAIPQHQALVWAVEELPRRDAVSFDPDAFVAEHHLRVPRWNPVARSALRRDWTSWPRSLRAVLDVELALRVLELKASIAGPERFDLRDIRSRQPSRVPGVDWRYEVSGQQIDIFLRNGEPLTRGTRPLRATVTLPRTSERTPS